jgi:RNA polymerase sigma-70 factor (ECF subfamily)
LARRDRNGTLDIDEVGFEPLDDTDIEREYDCQQREEAVRLAMASLPEEQLSLVRLAFFDGLSHSQISERTGLPLGTVKSRIRLAFTRLRRTLEADGVAEVG